MMQMTKRTEGKRNVDYGFKDYYKFYKSRSKNPVDRNKYNKVISEVNLRIVDAILNDNLEYAPTHLQFTFAVRKTKREVKIKDGKLVNPNGIDWKATKDLWKSDKDAMEKKIILRYQNHHTSKHVFRIKALKTGQRFTNKKYYRFKACRSFARALAKRINDTKKDKFDAYNIY